MLAAGPIPSPESAFFIAVAFEPAQEQFRPTASFLGQLTSIKEEISHQNISRRGEGWLSVLSRPFCYCLH